MSPSVKRIQLFHLAASQLTQLWNSVPMWSVSCYCPSLFYSYCTIQITS